MVTRFTAGGKRGPRPVGPAWPSQPSAQALRCLIAGVVIGIVTNKDPDELPREEWFP